MRILLALKKDTLGMTMNCNQEIVLSPYFLKWQTFIMQISWSPGITEERESKRTQLLWEQLFNTCQFTQRNQL